MFTGLIEDVGSLIARLPQGNAAKLDVRTSIPCGEILTGDSIAVNGACLTAESASAGIIRFHTLNETLQRTNLGKLKPGAPLNLERALRLGDRLGGHLVSGHIDTTAPILAINHRNEDIAVTIALPAELAPLLIPKGSIAVSGISLTIAELAANSFTVCLIPHSWKATNLSSASPGDLVNLEADMMGKYVLRSQQLGTVGKISLDTLLDAGF